MSKSRDPAIREAELLETVAALSKELRNKEVEIYALLKSREAGAQPLVSPEGPAMTLYLEVPSTTAVQAKLAGLKDSAAVLRKAVHNALGFHE